MVAYERYISYELLLFVLAVLIFRFDGSKPRSVVEAYILDHLAPLVVGSQEEARRNGFVGEAWLG